MSWGDSLFPHLSSSCFMHFLWYDEQGYDRVKLYFIIFYYQNISTGAYYVYLWWYIVYGWYLWMIPMDDTLWMVNDVYATLLMTLNTTSFVPLQIYAVICIMAFHYWECPSLGISAPEHRLQWNGCHLQGVSRTVSHNMFALCCHSYFMCYHKQC